jgi:hypothetical protein
VTKLEYITWSVIFGFVLFGFLYAIWRQELRRDASFLWVVPLAIYTMIVGAYIPEADPIRVVPASESMPVSACDVPEGGFRIFLGSNVVSANRDQERFVAISSGSRTLLELSRVGGQLRVSAQVFDNRGVIIAEVEDNKLTRNPSNSFKVEQTDDHEFEVFDQRNLSAIKVRMVNRDAVVVTGRFFTPSGRLVDVTESQVILNGGAAVVESTCIHDTRVGFSV